MTQNQHLLSNAIEETPGGPKAMVFSYKLYFLPSGDLQSSISNVDPKTIRTIMSAENYTETGGVVASAIELLLREAELLDKRLEEHLKSLE